MHLEVDFFKLIDASHSLLEEGTSQILFSYLEFSEFGRFLGFLLRLNDDHILLEYIDDSFEDVLIKLLDLMF